MKRVIYCPSIERNVPLAAYIAAVKKAKAHPEMEFKQGLTTWWPTKGKDIVDQFMRGVQERINAAVPYVNRGKI